MPQSRPLTGVMWMEFVSSDDCTELRSQSPTRGAGVSAEDRCPWMTPAPGPGLTPSRNRPSQSAARTPSGPCALALAILLSTREASSRRLGSSHHQGASIRLSSAGPALSSELGAGRDPLWPVLGIFSIAGWNREVRSKAASFLGLICSDCVPTGARTWAFHRRCFRRAGLRSGSPGACGARETERQGPEDGPQAVRAPLGLLPRGGASDLGRSCLPSSGRSGAARTLDRASSPSRPWSSCGLRHAPTRRRRWAAEKGVGGTHWPGIWHRTWLVNAWRPPEHTNQFLPSILPVGSSTRNSSPFSPRRF